MTPDNSNRAEPHADRDLHDDLVAGLGRRLAARCIDTAMLCVLAAGATTVAVLVALFLSILVDPPELIPIGPTDSEKFDNAFRVLSTVLSALLLVPVAALEAWLLRCRSQSLGKDLCGIAVVRCDELCPTPKFGVAALRWVIVHAPGVAVGAALWTAMGSADLPIRIAASMVCGIGACAPVCLTALLDERRRGWHDRAAGTIVVRFDAAMRDRLAASRPVRARRRPFFAELRAATLEQYEADAAARDGLEARD